MPASSIAMDDDVERAEFAFPIVLQPGPARLSCSFKGILNDKLRGFYRSTWRDDAGNDHVIATTQFESTNARRAFPCFDEHTHKLPLAADDYVFTQTCSEASSALRTTYMHHLLKPQQKSIYAATAHTRATLHTRALLCLCFCATARLL